MGAGLQGEGEPLWVNLIEMEAMTPLPAELSDTLVIQAMFSVALAASDAVACYSSLSV